MHIQQLGKYRLHLFAVHDFIKLAMLQVELRCLEVIRQLLANRLLDDNPSGKTDQRSRLGQIIIAQLAKLAETPPVVGSVITEI